MIIQPSAQPPVMTTITISGGENTAGDVPPPSTTRGLDGSVNFENQNYNINVADTGDINVTNKQTNEMYFIQSNLRVNVGGVQAFYFEGTTTFELDDGTKITIDTAPRKAVDYAMLVSTAVAIFDGNSDYGVLIENLDGIRAGEITFEEVTEDELAELGIGEGNALSENVDGEGFVAIDEHGNIQTVDQKWISNTDEIQVRTRGLYNQFSGMVNFISGVSQISFSGTLLSIASHSSNRTTDHHPKSAKREFRPQIRCELEDAVTVTNTATSANAAKSKPDDTFDSPTKETRETRHKFHFVLARSLRSENSGI
jgi:hypothetical protein